MKNIQQSLKDSQSMIDSDKQKVASFESHIASLQPQLESSTTEFQMQEQASVQAETDMSIWQEKWDQFRRNFHKVHESAQIENRGIEHIEISCASQISVAKNFRQS